MIEKKHKVRSALADVINFLLYTASFIGIVVLFNKYLLIKLIAAGVTMTAPKIFLLWALVLVSLRFLAMTVVKFVGLDTLKPLFVEFMKVWSIVFLSVVSVVLLMELILSMFIAANLTVTPLSLFFVLYFSGSMVYNLINSFGMTVNADLSKNDSELVKLKVVGADQSKSENADKFNKTKNIGPEAKNSNSGSKLNGTQNHGHVSENELALLKST